MNSGSSVIENNLLIDFIVNPSKRVYRHLLLVLFFGLLLLSNVPFPRDTEAVEIAFITGMILFCVGVIYFNLYVLAPRLLFKNKYGQYFLSVLLIMAGSFVFTIFILMKVEAFHPEIQNEELSLRNILQGVLSFAFLFGMLIAASTAIKLFQRWIKDRLRIFELEKNTMQSELELLKNQITPHFLFNTLNNTNVLISTEPEKASDVVMTLSALLRYQLYESARESVLLSSDIRFLKDFLDLEKVRRDDFEYAITVNGNSNILIPPLLFIPFVENAVKHSADCRQVTFVTLDFVVGERDLDFACVNSKPADSAKKSAGGGLGLANIRRRLDLLYEGRATLQISETDDIYKVSLNIKL
ncbi:MAG: histidine kinase [Prevotellaceae bacterium]|jgi:LytS/YehU family sensor histidine kinase|nr:histidine kinase [Prevotellaceae bacterium]